MEQRVICSRFFCYRVVRAVAGARMRKRRQEGPGTPSKQVRSVKTTANFRGPRSWPAYTLNRLLSDALPRSALSYARLGTRRRV